MNARTVPAGQGKPVELIQDGESIRLWLEPPSTSDTEDARDAASLLAALLGTVPGIDAATVAATLIATFGSLTAVLAAQGSRLAIVPGMSGDAIRLIRFVHTITGWSVREDILERDLIDSFSKLKDYVQAKLRCQAVETVFGLFLDRKNRLIREVQFNRGTVDHVMISPREVVRQAILLDASAIILVHNHPSGDPTPSRADIDMTDAVASALATIDVALHDHLIVGNNRVASVRTHLHLNP